MHTIFNELAEHKYSNWDADDEMNPELAKESPLWQFCSSLHERDHALLASICLICSEKTISFWNEIEGDTELKEAFSKIQEYLDSGDVLALDSLVCPVSVRRDCLGNITHSARDSVYWVKKYLVAKDPLYALYSLSASDCCFDESGQCEQFRDWLVQKSESESLLSKYYKAIASQNIK